MRIEQEILTVLASDGGRGMTAHEVWVEHGVGALRSTKDYLLKLSRQGRVDRKSFMRQTQAGLASVYFLESANDKQT